MPAEVPPTRQVQVSLPLKRRLEDMRDEKIRRAGRQVTLSEIISDLLAEHDNAMEASRDEALPFRLRSCRPRE